MEKKIFIAKTVEDLDAPARYIVSRLKKVPVLIFDAPMGAGKTTLSAAICRELGVTEDISSPTYALVNEYVGADGKIYHLDLYRLKDEKEAFEAGVEEFLHSGNICLVEWAEKAKKLLPETYVRVVIEMRPNERTITIH